MRLTFNRNVILFSYCVMTMIAMFVFLSSTQSFVLNLQLNIVDNVGNLVGILAFYDELVSIVMVFFWGVMADLTNIRLVFCIGFLFMSLGLFLYTIPTTFPFLVLARLVFAIGGAACSSMLTAFVASYSNPNNRGFYAALSGISSGVGAIIGALFLLRLPTMFNTSLLSGTHYTYYIAAIASLVAAVVSLFFPRVPFRYNLANFKESIAVSLKSLKCPMLMIAYLSSFASRSNTVIVSTFLPLWVNVFFVQNDLCVDRSSHHTDTDLNNNDFKNTCANAFILASTLSGITQSIGLISAGFFGFLIDFIRKRYTNIPRHILLTPLLCASIISCISYTLISLVQDPRSSTVYAVLPFLGIGELGVVVSSISLLSDLTRENFEGTYAGVYSFFGGLGILFVSRFGGYLFDIISNGAFITAAALHLILIICIIIVLMLPKPQPRHHGEEEDQQGLSPKED